MGALFAFQPVRAAGPTPPGWEAGRARIVEGNGLPLLGEAGEGTRVAKFGRRGAGASTIAASARGWLAAAGSWDHPEVARPDDGDALLALLEERGAGALEALDGIFAVAWHDARDGNLTVALDPLGRLRTCVAEGAEGVYLSTSAAAVAVATGRTEPDPLASGEFLSTGTLREGRTPFAGVRLLQGGVIHRFAAGRPAESTALRPLEPESHEPVGPDELADRVLAAYERPCRRFLAAFPHPLVDLTGGLDSRLVVALLARAGAGFDVTVTGREDEPEVAAASSMARRLGLRMLIVPERVRDVAKRRLDRVHQAARLCEGAFDAAEYAAAAAVHARHLDSYGASVNGSGGALFRNYWWGAWGYRRRDGDPVSTVTRHLAAPALEPGFLDASGFPGAEAHVRGVVERALGAWDGRPLHSRLDHALLTLRIGCWQGAFASATNQVWPTISPLLWSGPLRCILGSDPAARVRGRLIHALLERMPVAYRTVPLATGFPPMRPSAGGLWRFLPGLGGLPGRLLPRVRSRFLGPPGDAAGSGAAVADLMLSGASDYLEPGSMALGPLLDRPRYAAFLDRARAGAAPLPLVGRLVALEAALR